MDARPEKLLKLMRETRAEIERLETGKEVDQDRDDAQFKALAEAVVRGFDILQGK
jgi:hypothetical protein